MKPLMNEDGTANIIGHKFRPMTQSDYLGFGGATPGSFICECEGLVLIAKPNAVGGFSSIAAVDEEGTEVIWSPALR